ncbi:MAG TPA: hypothetical protein VND93_26260, partial [Myxococcales bacterium]|nr:hypothetical protein [Myxococcales bacterium]
MPEETPKPSLLKRMFGELHWAPPPWMRASAAASTRGAAATRDWVKRHRTGVLAGLLAVVALSGAGYYGYRWWESRPKPVEFSVNVQAPGLTAIEETPHFRPV